MGSACVPCIFRDNNCRYVPIRIVESEVRTAFINKLKDDAFKCVNIEFSPMTKAESDLLNVINKEHCDLALGLEPFNPDYDHIVKLDDVVEFYNFMSVCYDMVSSPSSSGSPNHKCGFVRMNNDNNCIIPYVTKNNLRYLPLFYFDDQMKRLEAEAIGVDMWDLAYLKFCCIAQGIKHELIPENKCLVISLEEIRSYFAEDTKFDDFWLLNLIQSQPAQHIEVSNSDWSKQSPLDGSSPAIPSSNFRSSVGNQKANKQNPFSLNNHNTNSISVPVVRPNVQKKDFGKVGNSYSSTRPMNHTYMTQKKKFSSTPKVNHSIYFIYFFISLSNFHSVEM